MTVDHARIRLEGEAPDERGAGRRNSRLGRSLALQGLLLLAATLGEAADIRLAVIPGEHARRTKLDVGAGLEASLSRMQGVALVDRIRIARVLEEQKLAASGAVDPATASKLGGLLSADVLVIVEGLGTTNSSASRIHIVETRSGVTLDAVLGAERWFVSERSYAIVSIRRAIAKLRTPQRDRRYVSVLGFRSEEPGGALDGYAAALTQLFTSDLAASPSVVVLDREHLRYMTRERKLTGSALALRASTRLIDAGLKRVEGPNNVRIAMSIRPLAGGRSETITVHVPQGNLRSARAYLTSACLKFLKAQDATPAEFDTSQEADVFRERAEILTAHAEHEDATRAAEAALALTPDQATRTVAAKAWKDLAYWLVAEEVGRSSYGKELADADTALKERILSAHLRGRALTYELYREHEKLFARGEADKVRLTGPMGKQGTIRIPITRREAQVARLTDAIEKQDRQMYRFELDYYAIFWDRKYAQNHWWTALTSGMDHFTHWADDVDEYARLAGESLDRLASPPGKVDLKSRQWYLARLPGVFMEWSAGRFESEREREVIRGLLDRMAGFREPILRMTASIAKLRFSGDADADAARECLDVFLEELPIDHAERNVDADYGPPANLVDIALKAIPDEEERARYTGAILTPVLAAKDARRIVGWRNLIQRRVHELAFGGDPSAAVGLGRRVLEILNTTSASPRQGEADGLKRPLERQLAMIADRFGVGAGGVSSWDRYDLEKLELCQEPVARSRLGATCMREGEIVLVWEESTSRQTFRLVAERVALAGGAYRRVGMTRAVRPSKKGSREVTCVATDGRAVYAGTERSGLAVFMRGAGAMLTEKQGLPLNAVRSVACLGTKVYVGLSDAPTHSMTRGALAYYDTRLRRCGTVASSRSNSARNALDGGKPYSINAIVPDAKRNCLWLGVCSNKHPWERHGVWRFDVTTRELKHVWKPTHGVTIEGMRWHGDELLVWSRYVGYLVGVDPDTLATKWYVGIEGWSAPKGCAGAPLYGCPEVDLWPCAFVGDDLITGGGYLYLHSQGAAAPAQLQRTSDNVIATDVRFMHELEDGALFTNGRGVFWRVRAKGGH